MAQVGFVGVGNMGAPMARNLAKAGHAVTAHDRDPAALARLAEAGIRGADSPAGAAAGAALVVSMLPAGPQVREAWLGAQGILSAAAPGAVLADCSTIDVATVREVAAAAGPLFLDAPVSGGVMGAEAATLTFMAGGTPEGFAQAEPFLRQMGRAAIHCGGPGAGQAAKACNNMMLAATMIVTCEAFLLAERLGLSPEALFEVASRSSGQSWSLTTYCPVPGPVPGSPANRGYAPGFAAALMAKDLGLAVEAGRAAGLELPLGGTALDLYRRFLEAGGGGKDFSGIIAMLRGEGG